MYLLSVEKNKITSFKRSLKKIKKTKKSISFPLSWQLHLLYSDVAVEHNDELLKPRVFVL